MGIFVGGPGNDLMPFSEDDDLILGGGGNDTISGHGGVDTMDGEDGIDTISYAYSVGGWRIDLLTALAASLGGPTEEIIRGFENAVGSTGADRVFGSQVANDLRGGAGFDTIGGRGGNDTLSGDGGDDILNGGGGDDLLRGGGGYDYLGGGGGDDRLVGGLLSDTLEGGEGSDTFVFFENHSPGPPAFDTIAGFDGAGAGIGGAQPRDRIDVSAIDANTDVPGDQAFVFFGVLPHGQTVAPAGGLWVVNGTSDTGLYGNTDGDYDYEFLVRIEDGVAITAELYVAGLSVGSDFIL